MNRRDGTAENHPNRTLMSIEMTFQSELARRSIERSAETPLVKKNQTTRVGEF
jgi:hypothetical protein